ncbi:hypothetical protein SD70_17110 [Gordoniibacillus kamchatkensis]|uniref:Uncharacterized protein n=1 Tax=Gordoniibacillus kamchatkensis TaxID=1590651 RepID=A0ABR5AG45_9BACL|nr:DUF5696 domain-containing protein [Paenibacillus sp. VKM B-2647]KIL39936.1 hypothetical protein SD70_17110 [Paenibacillus sp. VKM B-2647]
MRKQWVARALWAIALAAALIAAARIRQLLPSPADTAAAVQQPGQAAVSAAKVTVLPPEEGFAKVAETDRLELKFRAQDSAIQVKDKRDGHVWRSAYPLGDSKVDGNDLWKADSQSVFHLSYTNPSTPTLEVLETNSALLQPAMQTMPIDGGISVHYDVQQLGIGFAVEFRLQGGGLEVRVPADSIRESGQFAIMKIVPLPFFGAAGDDAEGYGFYPDGPGALSYFKSNHPQYMEPYRASVYGPDQIAFNDFNRPENAYLPVFGMKVKDSAYLGIITEGEYDCSVVYAPSGYLINLNRASAEFTYRRSYEAVKQNGNLAVKAEKNLLSHDHTVRYIFFQGDEADYSHMAVAYRTYLTKEKGLTARIRPGDPIPLGLDLLAGIKQQRIVTDRFLPATTFAQASAILSVLRSQGVESISANLLGWTKQDSGSCRPSFPPHRSWAAWKDWRRWRKQPKTAAFGCI